MTGEEREQAIEILKKLMPHPQRADGKSTIHLLVAEALNMAIKTLEQEPCEDCISRQQLKEKLQQHHDFFVNAYGGFSNLSPNDKSRVDEITHCIAEVVNMPSVKPKPKTEWIPVSKRLPKIEDLYLVSLVNEFVGFPHISIDGFIMSKQKWERYGSLVSAWMPLPEPYKEG